MIIRPCLVKKFPILFNTASCFEAFLQISVTWLSNISKKSMLTPKRVTLSSHWISVFDMLKEVMFSLAFFPRQMAWNLSGLAFHGIKIKPLNKSFTVFSAGHPLKLFNRCVYMTTYCRLHSYIMQNHVQSKRCHSERHCIAEGQV